MVPVNNSFQVSLDYMREEMHRQQQAMLNDLHNLRHEANKVNQDKASAHQEYMNLKNLIGSNKNMNFNTISQVNRAAGFDYSMPKYNNDSTLLRRSRHISRGSIRIRADHNIGSGVLLRSEQGSRNKGIDDYVDGVAVDDAKFFEKFMSDLNDIETINNRVERDIQFRTQQRINKFGKDGKRILGIHIAVPVEHEIGAFERYANSNVEREQKIKNDLYYTKKLIDDNIQEPAGTGDDMPEENFDIRNTDVFMG